MVGSSPVATRMALPREGRGRAEADVRRGTAKYLDEGWLWDLRSEEADEASNVTALGCWPSSSAAKQGLGLLSEERVVRTVASSAFSSATSRRKEATSASWTSWSCRSAAEADSHNFRWD